MRRIRIQWKAWKTPTVAPTNLWTAPSARSRIAPFTFPIRLLLLSTFANGDKKQQSSASAPTICWDNNTLCMMTKRGSKGHYVPNQDRTSVITGPDWCLASLFDGHGDLGHVTSQIAVSALPVKLAKQIPTTTTRPSPTKITCWTTCFTNRTWRRMRAACPNSRREPPPLPCCR